MEPLNDPAAESIIRVFLLIQNRLLREGLVRLFRRKQEFIVVGQSSPAEATPPDLLGSRCDVLMLDSILPSHLRLAVTGHNDAPAAFKMVLIGMEADERQFLAAVRSGVMGYLLNDASALDAIAAARLVSRGNAVCPPQLCSMLFRFVFQSGPETPVISRASKPDLTLRQQQLVALVAKGLTNKEIACQLNLSEFTVKNHIHRILKQVDATSRSQAVETIRSFGHSISP